MLAQVFHYTQFLAFGDFQLKEHREAAICVAFLTHFFLNDKTIIFFYLLLNFPLLIEIYKLLNSESSIQIWIPKTVHIVYEITLCKIKHLCLNSHFLYHRRCTFKKYPLNQFKYLVRGQMWLFFIGQDPSFYAFIGVIYADNYSDSCFPLS